MDASSRNVASFFEALQDAKQRLGVIWGLYQLRGSRPGRPFLSLSARPYTVLEDGRSREFNGAVALGMPLEGADGKGYSLVVDVRWDAQGWTITTEAWRDEEAGGQTLLREQPRREARDLDTCATELRSAIEDLKKFDDLIPAEQP